jgi:hypothetical protein
MTELHEYALKIHIFIYNEVALVGFWEKSSKLVNSALAMRKSQRQLRYLRTRRISGQLAWWWRWQCGSFRVVLGRNVAATHAAAPKIFFFFKDFHCLPLRQQQTACPT